MAAKNYTPAYWLKYIVGTAKGLRRDIESGYLTTLEEELHADVFADFLEMADHLVRAKLLPPAALVAGAALEAHLRAMASKAGITTGTSGKPKRAGKPNDDLKAKGVYGTPITSRSSPGKTSETTLPTAKRSLQNRRFRT